MSKITINGISLDPVAQSDALRSASLESADSSQSNYILIQTHRPLSNAEKTQLEDLNVIIYEYIPENTYLCGYRPSDLGPIRALPFVAWADVYLKGFKIPSSLRPQAAASASLLPTSVPQVPSRKLREVDVVLHDDVDPSSSELREQIGAAVQLNPEELRTGRRKVRLTVEEGRLDNLADLDEVHHIEEVPQRQFFNNVARSILKADVALNGTRYQGDGQAIAVADSGFDLGSTTIVHPAFTGRVARLYALGRTNPDRTDDPKGHGTHVAGSVLGNGTSATMGGAIQGTAPRATLVLQSILDSGGGLGGIPADFHDLFEPPYNNDGVRVHTNSWGPTTPGLPYDSSAFEVDDVVWNHPDLVICFSAGNAGTDANANGVVDLGSIGSQAAAKNCITVGASESIRRDFEPSYGVFWPSNFPADPINSDRQADDADGLAAFSSRGPTMEHRIKPDVVAPGTCILSALSRAVVFPSTGFGTSSDPRFFFNSGTSMATPLVAGCVAVLRETLVKNGTANPSAALLKALLINGAVELAGQYSPSEVGPSPNNNSGFGRVSLADSVIIPGPNPDGGFGEGGPLDQGAEETFTIDIPEHTPQHGQTASGPDGFSPTAAGATFKITLAWSDPPGAALQNDLDLIVRTVNGDERHGNMGTSEKFDRVNNVEQVAWTNMPPGRAEIVIRAFRITNFPQPYAYAWRIS
ncbi:S8 family serine peptidase [Protofrankia symbiont of Coriaria ruscifolia]|uniref:S8 family serine peptidase n=1 Tax=Protofrankia symbiont of Coriaria ruscifolia TaxID=1306542 RepID=UPI001041387F|nr:S8 family serine peptidase [Protofrankia symbiont of Coriaria ruscifolia]